jgi:hypothetical protein
MSLDTQLDFQQALFAHLRADANLLALLGNPMRLYDQRPQGVDYPYLLLQRTQARPLDADSPADELSVTMVCVSRFDGSEEVKAIVAAARSRIDGADLSMTAHRLINLRVSFVDVFRAADRRTLYGLMQLRAVVEAL